MSLVTNLTDAANLERLRAQKARLQALRDSARRSYASGMPVLQTATLICASMDRLLVELVEESLWHVDPVRRELVGSQSALIAVGGTGRGELAPYSDVDLLFLHERPGESDQRCAGPGRSTAPA